MEEIWKDIKGYEGLYQVSNFGIVKRLSRSIRISEKQYCEVIKLIKDRHSESEIQTLTKVHKIDIWRIKNNKISFYTKEIFLKPDIKKSTGYLRVTLCKKGKTKRFQVHRLVLEAFVSLCPSGMECRHLDNSPQNNRLDNLEWATHHDNMRDKYKFGTIIKEKCIRKNCKLNDQKIRDIRHDLETGLLLQKEIAKKYKVSDSQISEIKNGNQWSHIK